jgi:hypothetical protein
VRASEIEAAASARNANDESPGRNTQTPQYPAPTRSPTGIPAFPTVPSYMFKKDKQSHFDELKRNQISSTSVESPTKFQVFETILQIAGLLTLCMGIRTAPVPTADNPHGYTNLHEVIHKGRTYVIPADDVFKFQHDLERFFDYFHAQFHSSAEYISAQGFYQQDGIQIYKDMKKHFQGHQGTDILRLILILMAFKINSSLSIQEDVARLHKIFQDLDYALGHEFEVEVKLAIFLAHFQFDKRPGVAHYIGNLKFIKVSYEVARIGIEDITSPVTIGATPNAHSMKALSTAPIQYCHKFAVGTCTRGAQCKYVHKIDKSAPAKPSANKAPQSKPPSKTVWPKYISEDHRTKLGPFTGRKSDDNREGISKRQLYALNILQSQEEYSDSADTWRTGSIAHAAGSNRREHLRLNMLTASSSPPPPTPQTLPASSAATESIEDEDSEDSGNAVPEDDAYALHTTPIRFTPAPAPVTRAAPREGTILLPERIRDAVTEYNATLDSLRPDSVHDWYVIITHPAMYGSKDRFPDQFVLSIFGWLTRGPLRHLSRARPDVATGSPGLLYIMLMIGESFLDADVNYPVYHGSSFRSDDFMTLNPLTFRQSAPRTHDVVIQRQDRRYSYGAPRRTR